MKPEDDALFEVPKPEPFLAFIAGGMSGYLTALLLVLLVFPLMKVTTWEGHLFLLAACFVFAFLLAAVEAVVERIRRKR